LSTSPLGPQSWWGANWGNVASVAGLVVSFFAAYFAKSARKAANEARNTAMARTLAEEVSDASNVAAELSRLVVSKHTDLARVRASDLLRAMSFIVKRFEKQLSNGQRRRLVTARTQIHEVLDILEKKDLAAFDSEELAALSTSCRRLLSVLDEEHGTAVLSSERLTDGS
jgi:hypothetical protein